MPLDNSSDNRGRCQLYEENNVAMAKPSGMEAKPSVVGAKPSGTREAPTSAEQY